MSDISEEIEKFRQDLDACVAGPWINKSLLSILDALAARVEALEKRQQEPPRVCRVCGKPTLTNAPWRTEDTCRECREAAIPAASGGPHAPAATERQEQGPDLSVPKGNLAFDNWWRDARREISRSNLDLTVKDNCALAWREAERQQLAAGRASAQPQPVWKVLDEAAKLVEQWRENHRQCHENAKSADREDSIRLRMEGNTYRHCADQLAALLPPIPKGEAS